MNQNNFEKARIHFQKGINFFNNFQYDLSEKEFIFCLELSKQENSIGGNMFLINLLTKLKLSIKKNLIKYLNPR